ncbi:MAG: ribonuclease PH [Phycisphaerae bacterium]|jgi:ribonuclease PH|nr:ribonuclease PH [Phycisphaerae bacterium]
MAKMKRHDGRRANQLRPVTITPGFVGSADGSCLIETGGTRVICTASLSPGLPKWREGSGLGWLTAEYGMLPASTGRRKKRPTLKPDSRATEIQRLIGRVVRNVVRFDRLGENTLHLDCDVLEADGGTRTAAITGAYVAAAIANHRCAEQDRCKPRAIVGQAAAISVGIVDGEVLLDLDYSEDSRAEVDMNVAMLGNGKFVEVQGSAERAPFTGQQLDNMLTMARKGIGKLVRIQRQAIREGVK